MSSSTAKVAGVAIGATMALASTVFASGGFTLHPIEGEWHHHKGVLNTFDHKALRRGYEVYRQVCSTCHSMKYLHFRNLVGVTHTEAQAKMIAQTYEITDGPNDEGEMFERTRKLSDPFPAPYPNEEMARMANGGATPPDLSCIVKGRPGAEDYVFSLLTGYREAPAGVSLRPGLHYNPYFPDGAIGMGPPLVEGQVEFEDGTPASVSQMAKDVTTFLSWCSDPETNERKIQLSKYMFGLIIGTFGLFYWKTHRWTVVKNRRYSWIK